MGKKQHTFTLKIPAAQAPDLNRFFLEHGFEMRDAPYAFWQARGTGCIATFYKKGKLLLQGPEADVWRGLLGDETPDALPFHRALALHPDPQPVTWIGTDETGKGDYFGPLVVVGFALRRGDIELLHTLGVDDSKALSDAKVNEIARSVEAVGDHEVIVLNPPKYNELYAKMGNLNRLMAWAHARVIENLLERTDADFALVDRFADDRVMLRALGERGRACRFAQRPRAEADPAVAAASVIARAAFLRNLNALSRRFGVKLNPGAGAPTLASGRKFLEQVGREHLGEVAKLHFATTQQIGG